MKPSQKHEAPRAVIEALRRRAGPGRPVSFADFMDVVLYEPGIGYYRRDAPRIGRSLGTDFFTASSLPLFGRLVAEACRGIVAPEDPAAFDFVEIGAEPGAGILGGQEHPFRSAREVRLGEPLRLSGRLIVFSNELFDAQPFRRLRCSGGSWGELGVSFEGGTLEEVEMGPAGDLPERLPKDAPKGYVIDLPSAAAALAGTIAAQPWSGLFLALDYGRSWEEIAHELPSGTARAYLRHAQQGDLLASPGGQDLTCDVCWDWLAQALRDRGFGEPVLESQEAFFVRHCGEFAAKLAAAEAGRLSRDKLSLLQLLHPGNMGQKFQALWALRRP